MMSFNTGVAVSNEPVQLAELPAGRMFVRDKDLQRLEGTKIPVDILLKLDLSEVIPDGIGGFAYIDLSEGFRCFRLSDDSLVREVRLSFELKGA